MDSTLQSVLISLVVVCVCIAAGYVAYEQGMLDPIIEQVGYVSRCRVPTFQELTFFAFSVMMFKAKANAERQKYQAQGEKAGEDFLDCKELPDTMEL